MATPLEGDGENHGVLVDAGLVKDGAGISRRAAGLELAGPYAGSTGCVDWFELPQTHIRSL